VPDNATFFFMQTSGFDIDLFADIELQLRCAAGQGKVNGRAAI